MTWAVPTNWYWSVQDSSPGTQVWQSSSGLFVAFANADYVSFLAAGNVATSIDTAANLLQLIQNYQKSYLIGNPQSSYTSLSGFTTDQTLTDPVADWYDLNPSTNDNLHIILPQVLLPTSSLAIGRRVVFNNVNGSLNVKLYTYDDGLGDQVNITIPPVSSVMIFAKSGAAITNGSGSFEFVNQPTPASVTRSKFFATPVGATGLAAFRALDSDDFTYMTNPPIPDAVLGTTGSWTPTDQSGAALSFTGVTGKYTKIGNMIFAYGRVTYPATADGSNALIGGLPFTVPNNTYASNGNSGFATVAGVAIFPNLVINTTTFNICNLATIAQLTNAQLTGATVGFNMSYPVS